MSGEGHHWLRCNGCAVEFTYEGGRLTRTDTDTGDCGWHVSCAGAANTAEVWYSSGGYTRCPVSLQAELAAGRAVTLEAGAIIYRWVAASCKGLGFAASCCSPDSLAQAWAGCSSCTWGGGTRKGGRG